MIYKLLTVRQKGVIPFIFGLLLIHLLSKHNCHLLVDCTSTHFINSQCKIVLYRYLKNFSLDYVWPIVCLWTYPLSWRSVSFIKFTRISFLTKLFTFGLFWHLTGNLPNNDDLHDYDAIMGDPLREGIDAKHPAVWHYSSAFQIRSILSSCKNHNHVALWPSVRVTREKCRD